MRIRLSLVLFVLALFFAVWSVSVISGYAASASEPQRSEEVARTVNVRFADNQFRRAEEE